MLPFFFILAGISLIGVITAVVKIVKSNQMRKKGGTANSPIRDQRLRNKRR